MFFLKDTIIIFAQYTTHALHGINWYKHYGINYCLLKQSFSMLYLDFVL